MLSFGVRVAFTEIFRRFDADHDGVYTIPLPPSLPVSSLLCRDLHLNDVTARLNYRLGCAAIQGRWQKES
jgi:hypothetical protein